MSSEIRVTGHIEDTGVKSSDEIAAEKVAASSELYRESAQEMKCDDMIRVTGSESMVRSSISDPISDIHCQQYAEYAVQHEGYSDHSVFPSSGMSSTSSSPVPNAPGSRYNAVGLPLRENPGAISSNSISSAPSSQYPIRRFTKSHQKYTPVTQYHVSDISEPTPRIELPAAYRLNPRSRSRYTVPNTFVGSRSKQSEETMSSISTDMVRSTETIGQEFLYTAQDHLSPQIHTYDDFSRSKIATPSAIWGSAVGVQSSIDVIHAQGSSPEPENRSTEPDLGQGPTQCIIDRSSSIIRRTYGAQRYQKKQQKVLQKKLHESSSFDEKRSGYSKKITSANAGEAGRVATVAGATAATVAVAENKLIQHQTHHHMMADLAADYIRDIDDPYADNIAMQGVISAKQTAMKAYTATKYTKKFAYAASRTAHSMVRRGEKVVRYLKEMFSSVAGISAKAAAFLPIIAIVIAILIVVSAISSIVPTISLKTDTTKLTELYAYCTELDAKFSEAVSEQLNRTGFDRIDFYENGARSNGSSIWAVETDLDMLLAYYDAMFEDYSSNSAFQSVKDYSKELWNDLYTLSISTHIERHTSHHSDGSTSHYTVYVLDIYVDTQSLSQLAATNAKPEGSEDIAYDNVFDTPFGYLTDSQQDTFDALAEIGTFTALEEIANPFVAPDSDDEVSWTVGRRYGYYLNLLTGEYHPQFNHGLYLNSPNPTGSAVYAGFAGQATVTDDTVTIKSGNREVTYGNLTSIVVSSGYVESGTRLGDVGSNSPISTTALYMEYTRNGKEINPRFVVGGCSSSFSSVGNGDIVAVALSQVGTTETPVNQVMYNDWYYGHHVSGSSYAWCAVFVSWCADQCGYIDAGIIPKQAGCDQVKDWFVARGQFHWRSSGYRPKAGDLILYGTPSDMTHIGIVVSSDDSKVYTVEGNTSKGGGLNPNGGGVWTKSYALSSSYIQGYCTPAYPATGNNGGAPPAGAQKLGTFKITHYCPGACCNGQWSNVTATGAVPTPGVTIAVDPTVIPLNSKVYIEGYGTLSAQDTGGAIKGNRIDVLVATHAEANRLGVVYRDVYIVH